MYQLRIANTKYCRLSEVLNPLFLDFQKHIEMMYMNTNLYKFPLRILPKNVNFKKY